MILSRQALVQPARRPSVSKWRCASINAALYNAPPDGWHYLVALGSNRRHHHHGAPAGVLAAASTALAEAGLEVVRAAPPIDSTPVGPAKRRYANGVVLLRTRLLPDALLVVLKTIEAGFGRRRGRRWGSRVLDLDIVLWSGGVWRSGGPPSGREGAPWLVVPHEAFRARSFVLAPALALVPHWRDPLSGFSLRQLHSRLTRRRPAPR